MVDLLLLFRYHQLPGGRNFQAIKRTANLEDFTRLFQDVLAENGQ